MPLTARILQVVDVYDALTTDRPYRRALEPAPALELLDAEARRGWWDPRVVGAFREVVARTHPVMQRGRAMTARVLVVEDNPTNLEVVAAFLEKAGCQILPAETAEAGLQIAAAARLNLISVDVQVPGSTADESTRRLNVEPATADTWVVALAAHAGQGKEARASEVGCAAYLRKPLETRVLRETLRRFLSRREAPAGL